MVAGTPKWVRDLGYERFRLHGNGQGWQILRQLSPTQSHSNFGAAEKAISTVRGLAGTYLAVIQDKNLVFRHYTRFADGTVDHQTRCVGSHKI